MEFRIKYITEDIKLSCYDDKLFKTEVVFDHHMLVWFISGETKIIQADQNYLFRTGDIFLIPRNQLATIINYPKDGQPHKSVVMHLSIDRLRQFYAGINVNNKIAASENIRVFPKHLCWKVALHHFCPILTFKRNFQRILPH